MLSVLSTNPDVCRLKLADHLPFVEVDEMSPTTHGSAGSHHSCGIGSEHSVSARPFSQGGIG